jgi:hypothetical protein
MKKEHIITIVIVVVGIAVYFYVAQPLLAKFMPKKSV